MIGRNSIVRKIKISKYAVKVQANKHFGICDIIVGKEEKIKEGKKKVWKFLPQFRATDALNTFWGRQINDDYVMEKLTNTLTSKFKEYEREA